MVHARVDEDVLQGTAIDLLPQARDMHVDDIGLRIEVIVPDRFEQHGPRHHLPGMAHQVLEQAELARLQLQHLATALDAALEQVHLQVGHAQAGVRLRTAALATQQAIQPRRQFGEGKRFRQVVIGAAAQALDALLDIAERGQDQGRGAVAAGAQGAQQFQAFQARQHAVEHQRVVVLVGRQVQTVRAGGGVIDAVPGLAQALGDELGDQGFIFDQQHAHWITPRLRPQYAGAAVPSLAKA